jgi:uncharacterized membrane protein YdjX (TVP38/TMEM64 family)
LASDEETAPIEAVEPRRAPRRRATIALGVFLAVGLFLLFGAQAFGLGGEAAARRWLTVAHGPLALPAVIVVFAVLAFVGVPQVALIAAAVLVFGPWLGGLYSWIGTMASAMAGFWLGRLASPRMTTLANGSRTQALLELVERNGFVTSAAVRLAPFAPFVLINMAAGASRMSAVAFAGGTGVGIVPKIIAVAAAGGAASRLLFGGVLGPVVFFVGVLAAWLVAGMVARRWLGQRR